MKRYTLLMLLFGVLTALHAQEDEAQPHSEKGKIYYRFGVGSMASLNPLLQGNYYDPLVLPKDQFGQVQFLQFSYFFTPKFGIELNVPFFFGIGDDGALEKMTENFIEAEAPGFLNPGTQRRSRTNQQTQFGQAALLFSYRNTLNKWTLTTALGPGVAFYSFEQNFFDIKQEGSHRVDKMRIFPEEYKRSFFMLAGNAALGYRIAPLAEISLECNMRYFTPSYHFTEVRTNLITNEKMERTYHNEASTLGVGWTLGVRMVLPQSKFRRR